MIFNLSTQNSIGNQFVAELRSTTIQTDRMRFRRNMERIGEVLAYEISKVFQYEAKAIETPLGIANVNLPTDHLVLATILRAGLPLHQGLLNVFDQAENAFVSAYRKHHKDGTFEINLEYISCPNLEGKTLLVADPMLATGASMRLTTDQLREFGEPASIHFVTAIASKVGVAHLRRYYPKAHIWAGAIDEELTAKSYIVPGLGDAGDLAYGAKMQE